MKNNLPHAVRVLAVNNDAEKICGVVGPEEMFNVPLSAVYTDYRQFVVEPLDSGSVHLPIQKKSTLTHIYECVKTIYVWNGISRKMEKRDQRLPTFHSNAHNWYLNSYFW